MQYQQVPKKVELLPQSPDTSCSNVYLIFLVVKGAMSLAVVILAEWKNTV